MSSQVRLAIAIAALIAAVAAAALLVGGGPGPGPTASPLGSASAAPSGPAATRPSAGPSATANSGLIGAATKAGDRVVTAIQAMQTAQLLTADDAGRLTASADGIGLSLRDGSLELADTGYTTLQQLVQDKAGGASGPTATELRAAVAALGNALHAAPFAVGTLPPGSYVSGTFQRPLVVLGLRDGWARRLDDGEVLALEKAGVTLAFHHTAAGVTADDMAGAVGAADASGFQVAPAPVVFGAVSGLMGQSPALATLYYDAGLRAYDPAPGDVVRIWVLDLKARPLTIELIGAPSAVAGLVPEVEQLLDEMVLYEAPAAG